MSWTFLGVPPEPADRPDLHAQPCGCRGWSLASATSSSGTPPLVDRAGLSALWPPRSPGPRRIAGASRSQCGGCWVAMAQVPASMLQAAALQGAGLGRRIAHHRRAVLNSPRLLVSAYADSLRDRRLFDLVDQLRSCGPPRLDFCRSTSTRAFEQGEVGAATGPPCGRGLTVRSFRGDQHRPARLALAPGGPPPLITAPPDPERTIPC